MRCSSALLTLLAIGIGGASVQAPAQADDTSFEDGAAPVLLARRKAQGHVPSGRSCEELERGFLASRRSAAFAPAELAQSWGEWSAEDREAITSCAALPCKVKLDAAEVALLAGQGKGERFTAYLRLVGERSEQYRKEGKPRDYEFPSAQYGAVAEPFAALAKQLGSEPAPGGPGALEVRKLVAGASSAPGGSKGRIVRQVVERRDRKAAAPGGRAEIWIRAVYTDHFFDAWGEYASFSCDPAAGWKWEGAILVDVDLLKNTDFFSKLGRGKMKSTSESIMQDELSRWREQAVR